MVQGILEFPGGYVAVPRHPSPPQPMVRWEVKGLRGPACGGEDSLPIRQGGEENRGR